MTLLQLRKMNDLQIHEVLNPIFSTYGRVLTSDYFSTLVMAMDNINIPLEGNIYVGSEPQLQKDATFNFIQRKYFGDQPIQIGYCNGNTNQLNGLEYHTSSEINVACTDMILLLGRLQDIKNNSYDTNLVEAFFIPKGVAIELYATTLHFAPLCTNEKGFKSIIILPFGTNETLQFDPDEVEDQLLFKQNKWLLAHPERKVLVEQGAHPGLSGPNWIINF